MAPLVLNSIFFFFFQSLTLVLHVEPIAASKVPAIIVFGDSSVDSGNNNYIATIAKSNFEPYGRDFPGGNPTGRFCNGRLPPDFISEGFGLKPVVPAYLDPTLSVSDLATGVCFASAATGYDNATADVLKVIPLWKQVEYYKDYKRKLKAHLGLTKAEKIIAEALYLVSIGTNDFLENYFALPNRQSQFTVQEYEDFLISIAESFIRQIYGVGARKISLGGLPPMGCLPVERTANFQEFHGCLEEYNSVALEFNGKLEVLLAKLNTELPGVKFFFSNPYDILLQIITEPSLYGFEVTEVGCCGTGRLEMGILCKDNPMICIDANKYVFWDAIHPTEKTNKIISEKLLVILKRVFL